MTILLYELAGADSARPFSPHCWKTVMSLAHKGLDFERISVPFTRIGDNRGRCLEARPGHPRRRQDRRGFLRDRALSGRDLSGSSEPVRRARRRRHGQVRGALVAAYDPQLIWAAPQFWTSTPYWRRPIRPIFARTGRSASGNRWKRSPPAGRNVLPASVPRSSRCAARSATSRSSAEHSPLFADYIVFGALQWARIVSPFQVLADDDTGRRLVRALPRPVRWSGAKHPRGGLNSGSGGDPALAIAAVGLYRHRHFSLLRLHKDTPWRSNARFR